MIQIPLARLPNQSFTIQLDNTIYSMAIRFLINFMAADLSINNEIILSGIRIVPGFPIIPFRYLEQGNFLLSTANKDYPIYTEFEITQFLFYATQAEVEAFRAAARS